MGISPSSNFNLWIHYYESETKKNIAILKFRKSIHSYNSDSDINTKVLNKEYSKYGINIHDINLNTAQSTTNEIIETHRKLSNEYKVGYNENSTRSVRFSKCLSDIQDDLEKNTIINKNFDNRSSKSNLSRISRTSYVVDTLQTHPLIKWW